MAQLDNRGPAARKVELENRLDANAEAERRNFAKPSGNDAKTARKPESKPGKS